MYTVIYSLTINCYQTRKNISSKYSSQLESLSFGITRKSGEDVSSAHTYRYIQAHTSTYKHIQAHTSTYKHIQAHTSTYKHIQAHTSTYKHIMCHLLLKGLLLVIFDVQFRQGFLYLLISLYRLQLSEWTNQSMTKPPFKRDV